MWSGKGLAVVVVILAVVAPVAAEPGVEIFRAKGPLLFEGRFQSTASPEYVLANATREIAALDLRAASLEICVYHTIAPGLAGARVVLPPREDCSTIADAIVRIDGSGEHSGWLAAEFDPARSLEVESVGETWAEGVDRSVVSSPNAERGASARDRPDEDYFWREVTGPHLAILAEGAFAYVGGGALKIEGPDLRVVGRGYEGSVKTYTKGGASGSDAQWAVFGFSQGELRVDVGRYELSARKLENVSFVGELRGSLAGGGGEELGARNSFDGSLSPDASTPGTLLAIAPPPSSQNIIAPAPAGRGPTIVVALIGLVAIVSLGAASRSRIRGRRDPVSEFSKTIKETMRLVELQDYAAALASVKRARRLAPRSAELAALEGFVAGEAGLTDTAFTAYRQAVSFDVRTAEPALAAARLADRYNLPPAEILSWLTIALERDAISLRVVEADEFPDLRATALGEEFFTAASLAIYRASRPNGGR